MPAEGNNNKRKGSRLEGSGVTEGNNKDTEVTGDWVKRRS